MFREPSEKEVNLLPLVVHGVQETVERVKMNRNSGFGTCGQISLSLSGTGSFTDSFKRTHQINPGDILFMAPESPHSYEPVVSPWRVKFILFSGDMLKDIFHSFNIPPSGVVKADTDIAREIAGLFEKIDSVYQSDLPSRHITASAYLYSLLALISKNSAAASKNLESEIDKITPAMHYINDHFYNPELTAEMIARNSGISHPHLCRLFSSAYGLTPHDYLVQIRIDHAKILLSEQKNMPINRVAAESGFNSVSYFTKVFKEKTGLTPAKFRNQTIYNF
ncbi:MAG: AraC family transcriptional regulator [Oscillospiraceae bacterium]|nr:AraC family transcriptional regulator [Oscillospiraceae bacterium]